MDETLKQIEKYWAGELTQEEMKAFENKRLTDEAFATEVQLHKDIVGALRLRNNKQLKKRLDEIHEQEVNTTKTATVRAMPWKYIAAAVIAGLVIALSMLYLQNSSPDFDRLYANNFQPYEIDWPTRNAATKQAAILEQVQSLYTSGQYQALSQLLAVDSLQGVFSTVKFTMLKGISSMEQGQLTAARDYFNQAAANPLVSMDAKWYTALSFLKEGKTADCKAILDTFLADENSDYYAEAKALMEEL